MPKLTIFSSTPRSNNATAYGFRRVLKDDIHISPEAHKTFEVILLSIISLINAAE
jgi:hypothetical protein